MTTSTAHEVKTRTDRTRRARTMASSLSGEIQHDLEHRFETTRDDSERDAIRGALHLADSERWPSEKYRADPEAFAREVLGVRLTEQQVAILIAIRDHLRVAVSSGHKVGKSVIDAVIALWFFCSFPEARVIMSSVTSRQVEQILWRELRILHRRALKPIGGELHELARSGLKSPDFREVLGFTAREAEAVAGISGRNLLYILDEASGIGDDIAEAIEGNRAGGARVLMTSNPTRTEGFFFDAHHKLRATEDNPDGVHCFELSSEDTPNVREGRVVVPGLATKEWVEEKRREWGEDSPLYQVRVKGKFVRKEDGKVISLHAIELAEQRWKDAPVDGVLTIGLDPAGEGGQGDESAFAPRRALKVLELIAMRGLSPEAHLVHLLSIIRDHKVPGERPRVVMDREGLVGSEVYGVIRAHLEGFREEDKPFDLIAIRASDRATRQPDIWDRQRDALWGNAARWLRAVESNGEGGAIPEDTKLAVELHTPEWVSGPMGRMKVTAKKEIRKKIGRSPDRADAVCLAVWDAKPWEMVEDKHGASQERKTSSPHHREDRIPVMDPFRGAIDPYGGQGRI